MNVQFSTDPLHQVSCDVLAVGVGPKLDGVITELDAHFGGALLTELRQRQFRGREGSCVAIPTLGRIGASCVVVVGTGNGSDSALQTAAGRLGRESRSRSAETVALALGARDAGHAMLMLEAAEAGNYAWQAYKPENERSKQRHLDRAWARRLGSRQRPAFGDPGQVAELCA